jgi:hypothetical protein
MRGRCLRWVIFGNRRSYPRGLLCPHERTSCAGLLWSVSCQQETRALQNFTNRGTLAWPLGALKLNIKCGLRRRKGSAGASEFVSADDNGFG